MDFELYKKIIDDNPQLTSIILTRNGEPLLHKRIFDMVKYARNRNIHVNIYTNGSCLNQTNITKILDSDLSELTFSMEGTGKFYSTNRGYDYNKLESIINNVIEERDKRKTGKFTW